MHLDATGNLISATGKRMLLYTLIASVYLHKIKCLVLLECLSDAHDQMTVASVLQQWYHKSVKFLPSPSLIVTDMSWALMHGISLAFGSRNLKSQIIRQWNMIFNPNISGFILRLCANHLIQIVCRRLKKSNAKQEVR